MRSADFRPNPDSPLEESHPRDMPRHRLAAIAAGTGAQRYLEVGVAKGTTFLNVDLPYKEAVDPAFLFDVHEFESPQVRFFNGPSDRYFAQLPQDTRFDLVYLDGLHTFEQTYRDLCNVLTHAHPGTVILIDDTVPTSAISAMRNHDESLAARRAINSTDRAWHGDVFKVIFAIHDFHPSLNYVTFGPEPKGQSLIWQSKSFPRTPRFNNFRAIEAMTFERFSRLGKFLRYRTESDAIAYCLNDLRAIGAIPDLMEQESE